MNNEEERRHERPSSHNSLQCSNSLHRFYLCKAKKVKVMKMNAVIVKKVFFSTILLYTKHFLKSRRGVVCVPIKIVELSQCYRKQLS